jgi:hypothetical protein
METIAATRLVTSGPGPAPVILPAGWGFPRREEGSGVRGPAPILQNEPNSLIADCGLGIADSETLAAGGRRRPNVRNEPNLARTRAADG